MASVNLMLDGWPVVYYPAGVGIDRVEIPENFNESDDRLLVDHDRLRRFLIRLAPSWPPVCYLLHWSNGANLRQLDQKVAVNSDVEAEFYDALVVELVSLTCKKCATRVRVAVPDSGFPVFASDLPRRLREHEYRTECPECGEVLHPRAVEVFCTQ